MRVVWILLITMCSHKEPQKKVLIREIQAPVISVKALPSQAPAQPREVLIQDQRPKRTGSLMAVDHPRSFYFAAPPVSLVGQTLEIFFREEAKKKPPEPAAPKKDQGSKDPGSDELLTKLREKLPHLSPEDKEARIPPSIKMTVLYEKPNGDLVLAYTRESQSRFEAKSLNIRAELSHEVLREARPLTTGDLKGVSFFEEDPKDPLTRRSQVWEDEYTLRYAGFDEALSQEALDLKRTREELQDMGKQMENRMVSLGKERETMAKERDGLLTQMEEQKKALEEQKKLAEEQKKRLDEFEKKAQEVKKP
jgi:hypothetical protein